MVIKTQNTDQAGTRDIQGICSLGRQDNMAQEVGNMGVKYTRGR